MVRINKNAVVGDVVRAYAMEALDEEIYDIDNGDFTHEEIAGAVANLAMALFERTPEGDLTVAARPISLFALGYSWKAQSGHPNSWVSCSDKEGTGIGRSVCPIFAAASQIDVDEVIMLIEMMNEAWYLMTQKI